jgi:hypothetical protein
MKASRRVDQLWNSLTKMIIGGTQHADSAYVVRFQFYTNNTIFKKAEKDRKSRKDRKKAEEVAALISRYQRQL